MELLKSRDVQKQACACYNIATGFHLLGDDQLAARWLDMADQRCTLSLSAGLRKRLKTI